MIRSPENRTPVTQLWIIPHGERLLSLTLESHPERSEESWRFFGYLRQPQNDGKEEGSIRMTIPFPVILSEAKDLNEILQLPGATS